MGIGAAFATGLLKGFSDNMDKEGLRRQAMRDRFDGYETMAVDAVLKGDATTGGLNAIRNLVQKANTEIDSMEPIGPFGARGKDVTMDMAKVQSAMKSASDYNFKIQGEKSYIGFTRAKGDGSLNDANSILAEYASMLTDPQIQERLRNDKRLFEAVAPVISAAQARIMGDYKKSFNADTNTNKRFTIPNVFGGANSMFPGLEVHSTIGEDFKIAISGVGDISSSDETLTETLPDHTAVGTTVEPVGDGLAIGTVNIPDDQMPTYEAISGMLGKPSVAVRVGQIPLYNYWIGQGPNGQPLRDQFFVMPGMTTTMKKDALTASIQIANFPDVGGLDPDSSLYRVSNNTAIDFSNKLNGSPAKSFDQQVMALAPYMKRDAVAKSVKVPFFDSVDAGMTRSFYVLRKKYGSQAEASGKFTMATLSDELLNKETAVSSLRTMQAKRAKVGDVETYEQLKRTLRVAFIGEQSVRAAIQKDLLGIGVVKEQTTDLTSDFIESLDQRVANAENVELAELEAMRISLAFQLARAADPSGRLSNQDIQQQLDRLGAGFMSKDEALAKIQVVIDELDRDIKKLKVFVSYGKGDSLLTDNDARIIDAALAVDFIQNKASAIKQTPTGLGQGGNQSVNLDDYIIVAPTQQNPNGKILDQNMNTITDPSLIDKINKAIAASKGENV